MNDRSPQEDPMKPRRLQDIRLANVTSSFYGALRGARRKVKAHEVLSDQRGQAMTEYLIVTVFLIPMVVFITPLRIAVQSYLKVIYFMISLSIF
jgi:hypothetical protein